MHYSTQSQAVLHPLLAERVAKDPLFVEIQFANAESQRDWLREFLGTTPLISETHKRVARHFLDLPFDTSINGAFAASLGPHADPWRRFRAKKVNDLVTAWADRCGIELEALKRFLPVAAPVDGPEPEVPSSGAPQSPVSPALAASDPRAMLLRVVESLDDSELRQVLVPLAAVERMLRSRS